MELSIQENILKLVSKHLAINDDKVYLIYDEIKKETKRLQHKASYIKKTDISIPELSDIEHYLLTGIDLPVITSSNMGSNRKLMVIGSEPLRNWNYFTEHQLSIYNHIVISTPYSLHQQDAKETLYYKIIEHLTKTNQVYLTDLRKIWFAGFERHKKFIEAKFHNDFLLDEIKYINPEYIITFGKNVYDALSLLVKTNNLNIKVHYLIHPSQRTQGEGRKTFFEKAEIDISRYKTITNASERNVMPYLEYLDKIISP
jgi:hypothetical protein